MDFWKKVLSVSQRKSSPTSSEAFAKIGAQLYTKIFQFLTANLHYVQSRRERLKRSCDSTYYSRHVEAPLAEIIQCSEKLKRETGVQIWEDVLDVKAQVKENCVGQRDMATRVALLERRVNEIPDETSQRLLIGLQGQFMLVANCEASGYRAENLDPTAIREDAHIGDQPAVGGITEESEGQKYTFQAIIDQSQCIGTFQSGFTMDEIERAPLAKSKVMHPLQTWFSDPGNRLLWMYGPYNTDVPSEVSLIATHLVTAISNARYPVVAFRCQGDISAFECLVSMTYSFVLQLIWLVPDGFITNKDFSSERFALLDSSIASLPEALTLMEDLLTVITRRFIIVIDGFQLLEDKFDDGNGTGMFLNFLIKIFRQQQAERAFKILYTTNGFSERLSHIVDISNQIDLMTEATGHGGRKRHGRVSWGELSIC